MAIDVMVNGAWTTAVGTVMDGPLSRWVVNAQRGAAFHGWHEWATDRFYEAKDTRGVAKYAVRSR